MNEPPRIQAHPEQSKSDNAQLVKYIIVGVTVAVCFVALALLGIVGLVILVNKPVQQPDQRISNAQQITTSFSPEKTKQFWDAMKALEKNAAFKPDEHGHYPTDQTGQYNFQNFTSSDFESLRNYYRRTTEITQRVANDISALPVIGVDPELLKYKMEVCQHWRLTAQVTSNFADIVQAIYQQKTTFGTEDAANARTIMLLAGSDVLEKKLEEIQTAIDQKGKQWSEIVRQEAEAKEQLLRREQEVKTYLTTTYNQEFQ